MSSEIFSDMVSREVSNALGDFGVDPYKWHDFLNALGECVRWRNRSAGPANPGAQDEELETGRSIRERMRRRMRELGEDLLRAGRKE